MEFFWVAVPKFYKSRPKVKVKMTNAYWKGEPTKHLSKYESNPKKDEENKATLPKG